MSRLPIGEFNTGQRRRLRYWRLLHAGRLQAGSGDGGESEPEVPAGLLDAWFASDSDVTIDGADIGSVASQSGTRDASVGTGAAPSYVADREGFGPAIYMTAGEWLDLSSELTLTDNYRVHVVCHRDGQVEMTPLASSDAAEFLFHAQSGALMVDRSGVATIGQTTETGPHVLTWEYMDGTTAVYRNGQLIDSRGFAAVPQGWDRLGAHPPSGRDTDGAAYYAIAAFDASSSLAAELAWLATLFPGMWS